MISKYNLGHERMTPYFHRVRRLLLDIVDSCNGADTKKTERKFAERALEDFDAGWKIFERHDDLTQELEEEMKMMHYLKLWKEEQDKLVEERKEAEKQRIAERTRRWDFAKTVLYVGSIVVALLGTLYKFVD